MIVLEEPEWQPPKRGEVYLVSATIRTTKDHATRPAVVLQVPASPFGRIWIATRSTTDNFGHPSEKDTANGLTKAGRWSVKDEVEAVLWRKPNIQRLKKVLDIWDLGEICRALNIDWSA